MPRINLLPWREELRQKRKKDFLLTALLAVIAGAGLTFGTKLYYKGQIDNQEQRNALLRNEITALDAQIEEIEALDAQKTRLLARMEIIEELQRSRPEAVHVMDELVDIMPPGTYFTSVAQRGNQIEVEGTAQANQRVSDLMRNVDASTWLAKATLGPIVTAGDGPAREAEFKLTIAQANPVNEGEVQQ